MAAPKGSKKKVSMSPEEKSAQDALDKFTKDNKDKKLTDAQKAQIKATWDGLRPELKALHEQKGQLKKQMAQVAAAPTIDTARVEQLRQQSVALMDKGSQVLTRGLLATAQVLTPEQRKQVLAEIEKRHGHHGPKHDGEGSR